MDKEEMKRIIIDCIEINEAYRDCMLCNDETTRDERVEEVADTVFNILVKVYRRGFDKGWADSCNVTTKILN